MAEIVAVVWMLGVYITSIHGARGWIGDGRHYTVILPGAVVSLLGFTLLLVAASTILRMIFYRKTETQNFNYDV